MCAQSLLLLRCLRGQFGWVWAFLIKFIHIINQALQTHDCLVCLDVDDSVYEEIFAEFIPVSSIWIMQE